VTLRTPSVAQDEEPGGSGGEARGRRGLGKDMAVTRTPTIQRGIESAKITVIRCPHDCRTCRFTIVDLRIEVVTFVP